MKSTCPNCSTPGHNVGIATLTALVRPGRLPVGEEAWSFCAVAGCPIVYYSATGETISQNDVDVRIGTKVADLLESGGRLPFRWWLASSKSAQT